MKIRLLSIIYIFLMSLSIEAQTEEFETATEAVKNMKVGINWGWMEGTDEDWSNWIYQGPGLAENIKMERKSGFGAVRLTTTWGPHMDAQGKVDEAWMRHVHESVDYVIDQNLYCILNTHLDSPLWILADEENYRQQKERFVYLWKQIAEEFKEYDHHLLFEGFNEMLDKYYSWNFASAANPNGYDNEYSQSCYNALNKYAQDFVDAVRSTGSNNSTRNLIINVYCGGSADNLNEHLIDPYDKLELPHDKYENHLIIGMHVYFNTGRSMTEAKRRIDVVKNIVNTHLLPKGAPVIISEWGEWADEYGMDYYKSPEHSLLLAHYFMEQMRDLNVGTFIYIGPISEGNYGIMPAYMEPLYIEALMKGYYGEDYEPYMLTKDDYEFTIPFSGEGKHMSIYAGFGTEFFSEFRLELEEEPKEGQLELVLTGIDGQPEVTFPVTSPITTVKLDASVFGPLIEHVYLRHLQDGDYTVKFKDYVLKNKDGKEFALVNTEIRHNPEWNSWAGVSMEWKRKQFVHTVEYDGIWTELNIFTDDIPLKLKNYKGIRLELAEPLGADQFHIKIYGDGNSTEDLCPLSNEKTTTVTFDTSKFSTEINRITLQHIQEGKAEAKVICAWLIRHDGTEEYSDLSPFRGCVITEKTPYATASDVTGQYLVNPSFDSDLRGWTNTGGTAKWREHVWEALNNFCEFEWTGSTIANQKVVQTITLPAGSYRLSVTCASDPGSLGLYLIAGSYSKEMPGTGGVDSFSLDFNVAKESSITIGMIVENTTATWVNFDNFRLEKLETTAIIAPRGVKTKGNNLIYNMWGQRLDKLRKGINIINGKKVIVK